MRVERTLGTETQCQVKQGRFVPLTSTRRKDLSPAGSDLDRDLSQLVHCFLEYPEAVRLLQLYFGFDGDAYLQAD